MEHPALKKLNSIRIRLKDSNPNLADEIDAWIENHVVCLKRRRDYVDGEIREYYGMDTGEFLDNLDERVVIELGIQCHQEKLTTISETKEGPVTNRYHSLLVLK